MISPYEIYKRGLSHPQVRWLIIFLTVVYLFSPIDILPEIFLSGFGLIDDGLLLSLLVSTLVTIYREKPLKHKTGETASGETIDVQAKSQSN